MFRSKNQSNAARPIAADLAMPAGVSQDASAAIPKRSVLPAGLTVTGDLVGTGNIIVEGVVQGDITCRELVLAGEPNIEGTLEAESIRVAGTFHGTLNAKKVVLTKDARMVGDVYYETLEIELGAQFEGKLGRYQKAGRLSLV